MDTYVTAFNHIQDPVSSPSVAPTLGEEGQAVSLTYRKATRPHSADEGERWEPDEVAGTLNGWEERHDPPPHLVAGAAVRRLTPTECERLQAFPDGFTCLCGVAAYSTWDCRCPDGPRYAALGNAVTVNVVEWVGRRLLAVRNDNGT